MRGGFGGERGPGFGIERGPELEKLLTSPEQVFDSDLDEAKKQSDQVLDRLKLLGEVRRERWVKDKKIEFITKKEDVKSSVPTVQIVWSGGKEKGMMLQLTPVENSGEVAFVGSYGVAKENKEGYEFIEGESISLEKLFAAPSGVKILVRQTMTRWRIGKDDLALSFGKNTASLLYRFRLFILRSSIHAYWRS